MNELEDESGSRTCNSCSLCCRLPEIEMLDKPPDVWCPHCTGHSCSVYADRPQLCANFLCRWMTDEKFPDYWRPLTSHILVYDQGLQVTVLVDPDYPQAWRVEPYLSDIYRLADEAEEKGGYLILFCGDEVVKMQNSRPVMPA